MVQMFQHRVSTCARYCRRVTIPATPTSFASGLTTRSEPASFASDNASGADPAVVDALVAANRGHAVAYGMDPWTERAVNRFRDLFGAPVDVLFTFGGTGANLVGLQCLLRPWEAVICTSSAHISVDECGAAERLLGTKLIDIVTVDGKLRPDDIAAHLDGVGDIHHVQPRVVSITQSTETGVVYQAVEIAALAEIAHANGLVMHVDGARIANATAALGTPVGAATAELGVDVLTFGGTKNGLVYGEAVIFFEPELARAAPFVRKQLAQLPSKMRFIAAQFDALLHEDRWLANARHANAMARRLASQTAQIPGVELVRTPEVNAVFARLPPAAIAPLQDRSFFWIWDESDHVVRWMTSFDTTEAQVDEFAGIVAEVVADHV